MLYSSISAVATSVIISNLFLVLLTLCLMNQKLLIRMGYKLLALFVLFTALRYALPFELSFTVNLPLPLSLSKLVSKGYIGLFMFHGQPVSMWRLFLFIWAVGGVLGIVKYIISYCKASYHIVLYGKELTGQALYQDILNQACREKKRPNRFRVIGIPDLAGPVLFGIFSPKILLPENLEIPERDLFYILRHEASHHFHHDLLLKSIIRLITLIYWWNPVCILLNRQADVILEMRVDDSLTLADASTTNEYMQCLLHMSASLSRNTPLRSGFTIGLLRGRDTDLKRRFTLMLSNQQRTNPIFNIMLFLTMGFIYLMSYAFVPESFCTLEESVVTQISIEASEITMTPDTNSSYFIDNGNGTYDLYYYDEYLETTDSLEYYLPGIPVYSEENRPD